MNVLEYYTDGSLRKDKNNHIIISNAGFISVINDCVMNKVVYSSYPNINYLEALAIYLALLDIEKNLKFDKIIIYTDSDSVYNEIKNLSYYKEGETDKSPKWYKNLELSSYQILIINIVDLLIYILHLHANIQIKILKSHLRGSDQRKVQKYKYHNNISNREATRISVYNSWVDNLVKQSDDSQLYKDLPNFCIRY